MTDPTKTQPRGAQYTPPSDKPPRTSGPMRATVVASKALQRTGEHKVTEWLFALLGVALLGWDAYFLLQHPLSGLGDQIFHGAWALVAIALIPGAAARAAAGIREVGTAAAGAWKAKDKDGTS